MKNLMMLATLLIYVWLYNSYFGHNWLPQSDTEVIADGIGMLGALLVLIHWDWS